MLAAYLYNAKIHNTIRLHLRGLLSQKELMLAAYLYNAKIHNTIRLHLRGLLRFQNMVQLGGISPDNVSLQCQNPQHNISRFLGSVDALCLPRTGERYDLHYYLHKPKAGMTVTTIEETDVPELCRLVNQAYLGCDDSGAVGWTHEMELIAPPRINVANPKEFVISTNVNVFKFEDSDKKILGCIRVEKLNDSSADLSILSVLPSVQAKGVGSALLKAAEEWAKEKGCTKMEMAVVCHRRELQEYYKRRGYRETDRTIPFPIRPGHGAPLVPLHFIVFEKDL